jgi:hypothetical protein
LLRFKRNVYDLFKRKGDQRMDFRCCHYFVTIVLKAKSDHVSVPVPIPHD